MIPLWMLQLFEAVGEPLLIELIRNGAKSVPEAKERVATILPDVLPTDIVEQKIDRLIAERDGGKRDG